MINTRTIAPIYKTMDTVRKAAIVLLFAFIVISISLQIILRTLTWTDEILRYLNIWLVFLGASVAVKHSTHLQMDYFVNKFFPGKTRPLIQKIRMVIVIAFLLLIVVVSAAKTINSISVKAQAASISMAWFYLAIPVGSLLMAIEYTLPLIFGSHPFAQNHSTDEDTKC